jgi:hypothetical protein
LPEPSSKLVHVRIRPLTVGHLKPSLPCTILIVVHLTSQVVYFPVIISPTVGIYILGYLNV